jgi:hypothetical protein
VRSAAHIEVTCDRCDFLETFRMDSMGNWDDVDVSNLMEESGWEVRLDEDICPNCAEEEELGDYDQEYDELNETGLRGFPGGSRNARRLGLMEE